MFAGEVRSITYSWGPERCFTRLCSSLTCKHKTRPERLARDKRSSLVWKGITYGRKKYYNIFHRCQSYKTFFSASLTKWRNKLECLSVVNFFQNAPIFERKARSWAQERFSIGVGSGLALKYYTKLESLTKDRHSSLFCLFAKTNKKLRNIDYKCQSYITFSAIV